MDIKEQKKYMKTALRFAAKAKEKTYPNPMVGAVMVKSGSIIGKGYHKKAGDDHAEVAAIKNVSGSCRGAVMFVTLEPCDHHGKTPPCTEAIIKSGIKEVFIAMKDPNPIISGKGIKKLKRAGIDVTVGICSAEAEDLNRKYVKYITTGMPYITLKTAQSLDGKIAAADGSSKWITSENSRKYCKKMRSRYDAIIIGSNTLKSDDPFLLDWEKGGYDVTRIVVDTGLKTSISSNLIKTAQKAPVLIASTEKAAKTRVKEFREIEGVDVMVGRSRKGKVSLRPFFTELAHRGMVNVLVEGGGELAGSLLEEKLLDEVMVFIAPKMIGGEHSAVKGYGVKNISDVLQLCDIKMSSYGEDILVKGRVCSQG